LNSLTDKKVRVDESFERNYLSGNYGAVPEIESSFRLFDTFLN